MSFYMLLPFLCAAQAAPLVIDFQDGLKIEEIKQEFGIDVAWIHPNSEDESLAYAPSTLTPQQKQKLSESTLVEAIEESLSHLPEVVRQA